MARTPEELKEAADRLRWFEETHEQLLRMDDVMVEIMATPRDRYKQEQHNRRYKIRAEKGMENVRKQYEEYIKG